MRISDWSSDVCSSDLVARICGSWRAGNACGIPGAQGVGSVTGGVRRAYARHAAAEPAARKSVDLGKSVVGRGDLGCRRVAIYNTHITTHVNETYILSVGFHLHDYKIFQNFQLN